MQQQTQATTSQDCRKFLAPALNTNPYVVASSRNHAIANFPYYAGPSLPIPAHTTYTHPQHQISQQSYPSFELCSNATYNIMPGPPDPLGVPTGPRIRDQRLDFINDLNYYHAFNAPTNVAMDQWRAPIPNPNCREEKENPKLRSSNSNGGERSRSSLSRTLIVFGCCFNGKKHRSATNYSPERYTRKEANLAIEQHGTKVHTSGDRGKEKLEDMINTPQFAYRARQVSVEPYLEHTQTVFEPPCPKGDTTVFTYLRSRSRQSIAKLRRSRPLKSRGRSELQNAMAKSPTMSQSRYERAFQESRLDLNNMVGMNCRKPFIEPKPVKTKGAVDETTSLNTGLYTSQSLESLEFALLEKRCLSPSLASGGPKASYQSEPFSHCHFGAVDSNSIQGDHCAKGGKKIAQSTSKEREAGQRVKVPDLGARLNGTTGINQAQNGDYEELSHSNKIQKVRSKSNDKSLSHEKLQKSQAEGSRPSSRTSKMSSSKHQVRVHPNHNLMQQASHIMQPAYQNNSPLTTVQYPVSRAIHQIQAPKFASIPSGIPTPMHYLSIPKKPRENVFNRQGLQYQHHIATPQIATGPAGFPEPFYSDRDDFSLDLSSNATYQIKPAMPVFVNQADAPSVITSPCGSYAQPYQSRSVNRGVHLQGPIQPTQNMLYCAQ